MIRRLKSVFTSGGRSKEREKAKNADPAFRQLNPIKELQILRGHKNIVRLAVRIDDESFASCSDDGTIIVWRYDTGQRYTTLKGHTKPVNCLIVDQSGEYLVSGSSDKTIRIWSLDSGECLSKMDLHHGSIRCLTFLYGETDRFCSAANDGQLRIWHLNGGICDTIERGNEENIHCLLAIPNNRVLVGSTAPELSVYSTVTMQLLQKVSGHNESVRCLVLLSERAFASSSLNGGIIVWKTEDLSVSNQLNFHQEYFKHESDDTDNSYYRRIEASSVAFMIAINSVYLGACVGNGFVVYNTKSGECVAHTPVAHESQCVSMIALYNGTCLATCSTDASIHLWGSPDGNHLFDFMNDNVPTTIPARTSLFGSSTPAHAAIVPICLGDLGGHSDAVHHLVKLSEESFASCSADNSVMLWKDGRSQMELRNHLAALTLLQYHRRSSLTDSSTEDPEDESEDDDGREVEDAREVEEPPRDVGEVDSMSLMLENPYGDEFTESKVAAEAKVTADISSQQ